jgi:hypothetical protein
MSDIKIEAPEFSDALLSALESTLRSHDLRLRPGQTLQDVAVAFKANQVQLSEANGYLTAEMHGAPVHVNVVMESLTTKTPEKFFPRDVSTVKSKDEMDVKGRVKFINEHGEDAYSRLPVTADPDAPTVLDKSKITASQYRKLPRATKVELLNHWSPDDVAKILARK